MTDHGFEFRCGVISKRGRNRDGLGGLLGMKVFVGISAENSSTAEKNPSNWRKHAEAIGQAKSTVEKYPHMLDPRSRGSGEYWEIIDALSSSRTVAAASRRRCTVRTTYKVLPVWWEGQQLVKYPRDPGVADTDGRLTGSAQSGNPGWLSWCVRCNSNPCGSRNVSSTVSGCGTREGDCLARSCILEGQGIGPV
jgi:hypothetical protein